MVKEDLNEISELLKKSPLRGSLLNTESRRKFFAEEISKLSKIDSIICGCIDSLSNPLKVVLMGEVKAGKSTLLNALLGVEISYMNVVEATAAILEVKYSQKEYAVIERKDNSKEKYSDIKNLNAILDEKRNDQKFFNEIDKICIYTPIEKVKEITIVDTPGLNTVTSENENRTKNYIANCDVIVWVMNGNHLGQSDVTDAINNIMDYGKPILCVVNRIDEVDGEPEQLEDYVRDEMGYMFKEVFAVSAKMAFEGRIENNNEKISMSRFELFNTYLLNNIERNSENVQVNSVYKSASVQLSQEISASSYAFMRVEKIIQGIQKEIDSIEKFNKDIKDSCYKIILQWIDFEFFQNEKSKMLYGKVDNSILKKYFSEEYINNLIQNKYKEISKEIYRQWTEYNEKLMNEKKQALKNSISIEKFEDGIFKKESNNSSQEIKESSAGGAVTGAAVSFGLAGYAAWLGPGAAYITIGNAIGTFFPPLLIAGIAGGAVFGIMKTFKKNDQEKKILNDDINRRIDNIKDILKNSIADKMIDNLRSISDSYKDECINSSIAILGQFDFTLNEAENLINELNTYIDKLKEVQQNIDIKL